MKLEEEIANAASILGWGFLGLNIPPNLDFSPKVESGLQEKAKILAEKWVAQGYRSNN